MKPGWTLEDIPWDRFDPALVDPDLLGVAKAAAVVEHNAGDYIRYLSNVFAGDADFQRLAEAWGAEEVRHGQALGRWAELADPGFRFEAAFSRFVAGYRVPLDARQSVRGSRTGELVARCIVETGTSSLYSALRDAAAEPVLKDICHRIAGDEFRHYKLFLDWSRRYAAREGVGRWRRLRVALGRVAELDDDELAYAWHAANDPAGRAYDRERCACAYGRRAFACYRPHHASRVAAMILKAVGLDPRGRLGAAAGRLAWYALSRRAKAA